MATSIRPDHVGEARIAACDPLRSGTVLLQADAIRTLCQRLSRESQVAACHLGAQPDGPGVQHASVPYVLVQGPPGTGKTHTVKVSNTCHDPLFATAWQPCRCALPRGPSEPAKVDLSRFGSAASPLMLTEVDTTEPLLQHVFRSMRDVFMSGYD